MRDLFCDGAITGAANNKRIVFATIILFVITYSLAYRSSAAVVPSSSTEGAGVSRALAVSRAQRVSAVHYKLKLTLRQHADTMPGHEELRFKLSENEGISDLPLDYREGVIRYASLNDSAIATALVNGHLILPAKLLHAGENKVVIDFESQIAEAGAAITRYADKEDGSEYFYSLFVPMDASMAFVCFDQPDLKAGFTLTVDAPAEWVIISNSKAIRSAANSTSSETSFAETKPISTYLFAFAAGPWVNVHPAAGMPNVYARKSQLKRAAPEIPQLQTITALGIAWLTDYFQQPFPFPKYDIVLIPGFPFGGMEHAGATFLREDAVLFRTAPTPSDRFGRNILTLHELTHQWFGDLVTMRWFDDLWLKEGFAQYMAYQALDSLEPDSHAWKHFYEDIKPQAYAIDETEGTTPIFQDIPNLKDAKSAYGAIVYQKAPAILKQLQFRLGALSFRDGLRLYLQQHAYSNAQWSDLIAALHVSSGQDVRAWADAWILRRGMPEIDARWTCDEANRVGAMTLSQHSVLSDGFTWPLSIHLLLGYGNGRGDSIKDIRVDWNTAEVNVATAIGIACPSYVFANGHDEAYGRFLLDERSEQSIRASIVSHASGEPGFDPLLRSMLWGALWDNVHVAKSAPRSYVELVLANLPHEDDETLARIQGAHAATSLHSYMTAGSRGLLTSQLEAIATDRMLHANDPALRIVNFRMLTAVAETPAALDTLKQLLAEKLSIPAVDLRPLDRWNLVGHLIAQADPDAAAYFAAEQKRDQSGDGLKYAWAVQAGTPDAGAKDRYFAAYLLRPNDSKARPEDWLTQSLRPFNSWSQSSLTEPYLGRALDQLPEIKRDRKIFYLGSWLSAFLDGQVSPEADAIVQQWLAHPDIDPDLRRKVLENEDGLARTVRIRRKFPD